MLEHPGGADVPRIEQHGASALQKFANVLSFRARLRAPPSISGLSIVHVIDPKDGSAIDQGLTESITDGYRRLVYDRFSFG
jgi:hypothetical protein